MSLVFDSSALLVMLRNEAGAEFVEGLLDDADVPKYIHAANLCEIFYRVLRDSDYATAEISVAALLSARIQERADFDGAFWRDVAALIADRRRERKPLAFGDACGVALARRLNADFVTADHAEMDAIDKAGAARILFVRGVVA